MNGRIPQPRASVEEAGTRSARRVLKWDVTADGDPHLVGAGDVVLVACQHGPDVVQVWTEEVVDETSRLAPRRPVVVVGTGHPIPPWWTHIGSVVAAGGLREEWDQ